jgi:hypothetical protein
MLTFEHKLESSISLTTLPYTGAYLPVVSGDSGTWGTKQNTQTFVAFDNAIGGFASQSLTNINVTLSPTQSSMAILRLTGTLTGAVQVTTSKQGFTLVENVTTGSYAVTFTNGVGTPVTLPQSYATLVMTDATYGPVLLSAPATNIPANSTYAIQSITSQNITASSSTVNIDMSQGWAVELTLSANVTSITVSNWPPSGIMGKVLLDVTSTGAFTITGWPGTTYWAGGSPPTMTSGNGSKDTFGLTSPQGGTVFRGYVASQNLS